MPASASPAFKWKLGSSFSPVSCYRGLCRRFRPDAHWCNLLWLAKGTAMALPAAVLVSDQLREVRAALFVRFASFTLHCWIRPKA